MTKNTTIITGGEGTNRDLGIGEKVLENCKLRWQKKLRLISKKNTSTAPLNYPLPCRMNVSSLTPVSAFHLVLTLFLNTSIIKKKTFSHIVFFSPYLENKSLCWSCSHRMPSSKLLSVSTLLILHTALCRLTLF